jgi:LmbE family N-acetylglucosaminyl deacetylase
MAVTWRHRKRRHALATLSAGVAVTLALSTACGFGRQLAASSQAPLRLAPVDLLVFAPHPDDEVIGAGGILQRALESGKRVLIVFVTNGDGYRSAASALLHKPTSALVNSDYVKLAATRQREALAADHVLGVSASNLIFLGYPDGVLAEVYADAGDDPVQSPTTGRTTTYGPVAPDYHTLVHGLPAAYTRSAALADVQEILKESQPAQVLVTDAADMHPDHHATYNLVRDAIAAIGFRGEILTFVVHSGPGWPWPLGPTPDVPFASRTIGVTTYPIGVPWPPPIRIPLSATESGLKLQALDANRSELASAIDRLFLESFVKSEEVFWADDSPH